MYPVDSWGQKCGQDEAVKDKRFLFFFDITKCAKANVLIYGCRTPQVIETGKVIILNFFDVVFHTL